MNMHLPCTCILSYIHLSVNLPGNCFPAQAMQSRTHLYLAMPYAGVDLNKMLHYQNCVGGMNEDAALDLIMPIFDALRHLHGSGFAHRDIKSENILFTDDPQHVYLIGKVPSTLQRCNASVGFARVT